MDGQKSEGHLSRTYSAEQAGQPDRDGARHVRHRTWHWMRWVVAVLCLHAVVVAVLWGVAWRNVSEQDTVMLIELVSSGAPAEGQVLSTPAGQNSAPQLPAPVNSQEARPPAPSAPSSRAQRQDAQQDARELDPYSSTDPAMLAEPVATADSSEDQETESAPDLARDRKPAKAASRPDRSRPATPNAAPAVVKASRPPEPAAHSASVKPSEQTDAPASGSAGGAPPSGGAPAAAGAGATVATDKSPAILSVSKPPYPRAAYRARQEGRVTIDIEVLANGKVGEVTLNATSGVPSLDASALEVVRTWQYAPGSRGGQLSAQWIRVVVAFELKNR